MGLWLSFWTFMTENWELVKKNYATFITFGIIIILLSVLITRWVISRQNKDIPGRRVLLQQLDEQTTKVQTLMDEKRVLEEKIRDLSTSDSFLKGAYSSTTENSVGSIVNNALKKETT